MKILIEIFEEENQSLFGAEIFIDGKWFKEISGLPTKQDVLKSIADNEDILDTIS